MFPCRSIRSTFLAAASFSGGAYSYIPARLGAGGDAEHWVFGRASDDKYQIAWHSFRAFRTAENVLEDAT
jgi:hypothetical protein